MRTRYIPVLLAAALSLAGCDLDVTNPNAPTEDAALTTREGIVAVAVGMQARYASGIDDFIYPGGLLTDELGATAASLSSYRDAEVGDLTIGASPVNDPWRSHYLTIKSADDLLRSARNVTLGDSTQSGILALAYLMKAMSLGELLQQFEQIIVDTQGTTPEFVDREQALTTTLALIDSGITQYAAVRPGSEFNTQILARGFDLRNTLYAMKARYERLRCRPGGTAGCQAAADAAAMVDQGVRSVLPYDAQLPNPLFGLTIYVLPRDLFRLAVPPGDQRDEFHVTPAAITGFHSPLDQYGYYGSGTTPIPVYWPDEMTLIRAEALALLDQTGPARDLLNQVVTDCGGSIVEPNACLPPLPTTMTQAELLVEIYRQRRFELFATGLRWEDARRLGSVGGVDAIASRCWLLYPVIESNTNPNVPPAPEPEGGPVGPVSCFD